MKFLSSERPLKINIYMRNKIIIIREKTSPFLQVECLQLSPLIKFCFNAVVCYIVACFLFSVFRITFSSYINGFFFLI